MNPLTPRQHEVLVYIKSYIEEYRYSPSCADIGSRFNMTRKGAHEHVTRLKKKGYIETTPKVARSIIITGDRKDCDDNRISL